MKVLTAIKVAMIAALVPMLLSACVTSSGELTLTKKNSDLPEIPADVVLCFQNLTEFPENKTSLSKADLVELIIELRGSEVEKTLCGQRMIAWYQEVKNV